MFELEKRYKPINEDIFDPFDERLILLDEIFEWAEDHEEFDISFIMNLKDHLKFRGKITHKQYNSLVKTYYSFGMDKKWNRNAEEEDHFRGVTK